MIAGIVITHGQLAAELVNSAKTIVASPTPLFPVCLNWNDTWEDALKKVRFVMDKLGDYPQVLLFTDMFGGTPSNIAFSLAQPERTEVITGVNLPILVRFLSIQHENLSGLREISYFLCQRARQSIRVYGLKEDHDQ
jgi:PTS system mannose-specific IIA component